MIEESKFINLLFERLSVQRKAKKGGGLYPKKDISKVLSLFQSSAIIAGEKSINPCFYINQNYMYSILDLSTAESTTKPQSPPPSKPPTDSPSPSPSQEIKKEVETIYLFLDRFLEFLKFQRSTYLNKSLFVKIENKLKISLFQSNDFYKALNEFSFDNFKETTY